jgi:hypothetical protein
MMEAARTSETSIDIQLRTQQYIPEDSELQEFSVIHIRDVGLRVITCKINVIRKIKVFLFIGRPRRRWRETQQYYRPKQEILLIHEVMTMMMYTLNFSTIFKKGRVPVIVPHTWSCVTLLRHWLYTYETGRLEAEHGLTSRLLLMVMHSTVLKEIK